jgi:hypothetical protein
MREELMNPAGQMPFVPPTIELKSRRKISVRSSDHVFREAEKGSLIVVQDNRGLNDLLPVLHITAPTSKEPA